MKIAIVFFTQTQDAEYIAQMTSELQTLRTNNPDYIFDAFVYDDAAAPLPAVPDGVTYQQTTFERGDGLNGLACLDGMLATCADVVASGYDIAFKASCDLALQKIEWMLNERLNHYDFIGIRENMQDETPCYAMNAKAIGALQALLGDAVMRKRAAIANQADAVICRLSTMIDCYTRFVDEPRKPEPETNPPPSSPTEQTSSILQKILLHQK